MTRVSSGRRRHQLLLIRNSQRGTSMYKRRVRTVQTRFHPISNHELIKSGCAGTRRPGEENWRRLFELAEHCTRPHSKAKKQVYEIRDLHLRVSCIARNQTVDRCWNKCTAHHYFVHALHGRDPTRSLFSQAPRAHTTHRRAESYRRPFWHSTNLPLSIHISVDARYHPRFVLPRRINTLRIRRSSNLWAIKLVDCLALYCSACIPWGPGTVICGTLHPVSTTPKPLNSLVSGHHLVTSSLSLSSSCRRLDESR